MREIDLAWNAPLAYVKTTVHDLKGKRVALGSRASMQAGLLPYYFLQQLGLDPTHDLAVCSFYDERQGDAHSDERDVVERLGRHEYDAGAVSGRTIAALQAEGSLAPEGVRIIWSSPGYSHCSFTVHNDMDPALVEKITETFVAIDARDPTGKAVLEGEGCNAFVPGITTGWETLEKAAEQARVL